MARLITKMHMARFTFMYDKSNELQKVCCTRYQNIHILLQQYKLSHGIVNKKGGRFEVRRIFFFQSTGSCHLGWYCLISREVRYFQVSFTIETVKYRHKC